MVGCGRISRSHLKAMADNADRVELAAVCDVVEERARDASEAAGGLPWFAEIGKMLADVKADVALIGTPSGMHPAHAIQCAKAGLHVVCEKPMSITLDGADAMIKACDDAGVKLFVIKQNRLNQTVKLLRRAVDKGRFGRIFFAGVNVFWSRPQSYYDQAKWRGTWELDGGAFMNQASHYIDLLHWLVGEVDSVSAVTATLARRIETEDTGSAVLRFRNGAVGTINVTMLTFPKNIEGSITILGEKGTVKLGGPAVNKIEAWEFAEYDDDDKEVEQADYSLPPGPAAVYGFGHTGYLRNVLDTLEKKDDALTDGRHGRKSLELILAIYKSARDRQTVSLPLKL
ncbi:MAG: Gfo/Idh/MocA family oxidoreductase [Deltaproteobacteria bacterium]|nr:Gfo/Idh/MocA family oxidoreductase [Deltaproteobacteria bacterium]